MYTLYILGGPPRTAKTIIMSGLAKETGITYVAADAVEHGMRNMLTGNPHQMLRNIEFAGSAEWKTSITAGGERKPFSNGGPESHMTFQIITGMIDYYRRSNQSVAFEGGFTPGWAKELKPNGFIIRAAFTGYTNPAHADNILQYAKHNPYDWIKDWLKEEGGDETKIRAWVANQAEKCKELQAEAETAGFSFFDISTMPFDEYVAAAQRYLLTGENNLVKELQSLNKLRQQGVLSEEEFMKAKSRLLS